MSAHGTLPTRGLGLEGPGQCSTIIPAFESRRMVTARLGALSAAYEATGTMGRGSRHTLPPPGWSIGQPPAYLLSSAASAPSFPRKGRRGCSEPRAATSMTTSTNE